MTKAQLAKAVRVLGFMLVMIWAATSTLVATFEHGQNHDLTDVLKRRSPVTDYQSAEFGHTDCRKNYEDAFMAAIGHAIVAPATDQAARSLALLEVARYTDILNNIETNCPTPRPPEFDEGGKMTTPPFIPSTTTSTTRPG